MKLSKNWGREEDLATMFNIINHMHVAQEYLVDGSNMIRFTLEIADSGLIER
jgi:hypothetical protein